MLIFGEFFRPQLIKIYTKTQQRCTIFSYFLGGASLFSEPPKHMRAPVINIIISK